MFKSAGLYPVFTYMEPLGKYRSLRRHPENRLLLGFCLLRSDLHLVGKMELKLT